MTNLAKIEKYLFDLNAQKSPEYNVVDKFTTSKDDDKHTIFTKKFGNVNVVVIKIKMGYGENWYYDRDLTETKIEFKNEKEKADFILKSKEYYAN